MPAAQASGQREWMIGASVRQAAEGSVLSARADYRHFDWPLRTSGLAFVFFIATLQIWQSVPVRTNALMRLFRKRQSSAAAAPHEQGTDDVVSVDVGFDRFHAELLAEACRQEGCVVELLTMDDSGTSPGLPAGMPHRLLVRRSEREKVQAVLARTR